MRRLRILIVDDHALMRKGIASLIKQREDMEVVGEAVDGEEALKQVHLIKPDIVVMDIQMPRMNGIETTRQLTKEFPETKVVILTICDDDQSLFEAIRAGAQGYLLKNVEPNYLFRLLNGVSRGEAAISPIMASKILEEVSRRYQPKSDCANVDSLTGREREILRLVTQGATNREIGQNLFISENTVKNHMRNILDKLHSKNRVQAVSYAIKQGLIEAI